MTHACNKVVLINTYKHTNYKMAKEEEHSNVLFNDDRV